MWWLHSSACMKAGRMVMGEYLLMAVTLLAPQRLDPMKKMAPRTREGSSWFSDERMSWRNENLYLVLKVTD